MITFEAIDDWLKHTQSADMTTRTRQLLREGFRRRFKEHRNMDPINKMLDHCIDLRVLIEDFDLNVHNDVSNPDHIQQATAALDALEGHVNDLVP